MIFRNDGSKLYALTPDSGPIRWTTDVTEGGNPAFATHVYLLHEGVLSAFDPDTGDPVWHSRVPGDTFTGTAVIDSTVYVSRHRSTESDGRLYAFDAETGCRRGYFSTNPTEMTTPAGSDDSIFFGGLDGEGRLWAVSAP